MRQTEQNLQKKRQLTEVLPLNLLLWDFVFLFSVTPLLFSMSHLLEGQLNI